MISSADGGSLLLDEIGEMPIEVQPKLLRVLQDRRYRRIGSDREVEVDFRLICSTNRNPSEAIEGGHLREDLFLSHQYRNDRGSAVARTSGRYSTTQRSFFETLC